MRLLGLLYVTCNMYIEEVSAIQLHLQEYCDSGDYILSFDVCFNEYSQAHESFAI
jgi:hypothetical protein